MGDASWAAARGMPNPDRYPHGTRSRYVQAKCRCNECRAANNAYYRARMDRRNEAATELPTWAPGQPCPGVLGQPCPHGVKLRKDSRGACEGCRDRLVWNGMVDAAPAREHILQLSARGIGRRAVAEGAKVAESTIGKIVSGERTRVRGLVLRRILAVDESVRADASTVPAGPTWRIVRKLIGRGWTKGLIAQALGRKMPALQIQRKRVLLLTAHRVKKLWETQPDPPRPRRHGGWQPICKCKEAMPFRGVCAKCELPLTRKAAA